MTDFLTRLAERALGVASVVQPLIVSRFAPGPALAGEAPPGLEQEEAVESAGEGTQALFERETLKDSPPASPPPILVSEGAPPSVMPNPPQRETPDIGPPLRHRVEPNVRELGGTSLSVTPTPHRAVPDTESPPGHRVKPDAGEEDQGPALPVLQDVPSVTTPTASQRPTPETRSAPPSLAESSPAEPVEARPSQRRVGSEAPETFAPIPRLVRSEDSPAGERSTRSFPTPLEPPVKEEDGPIPPPEPSPETPKQVSESQRASRASRPERRQVPEAPPSTTSPQSPLVPRVLRPNIAARREPARSRPDEQGVALPELPSSPPIVRVTIGRVEVRAILLPTSPPPRIPPARRGPALSLDDYLKQRNEGQR